jgi:hypothetical protein
MARFGFHHNFSQMYMDDFFAEFGANPNVRDAADIVGDKS